MKRAWLNLRYLTGSRAEMFTTGLRRHGYKVIGGMPEAATSKDLFVTWNRVALADRRATELIALGARVLVVENATWGNDFAGRRWLHMAREYHNTAGRVPVGGPERFDLLGVEPAPFRQGGETVILPQRGIGSPPVAMPKAWTKMAKNTHGGRVRKHPGKRRAIPLETDLANCGHVVTWGSGAAVKALLWGIRVTAYMPDWIAAQDNTAAGRLAMFRRLAWAQHTHDEIENGEAIARLL